MQVPRDLLDQKLNALRIVLPTLLLESEPELYQKEFSKLSEELLQQAQPQDRDHAVQRLEQIRTALGILGPG